MTEAMKGFYIIYTSGHGAWAFTGFAEGQPPFSPSGEPVVFGDIDRARDMLAELIDRYCYEENRAFETRVSIQDASEDCRHIGNVRL